MTVERHEFRKRNTTSTVRSAPSSSASSTLRTECRDALPGIPHHVDLHARRQRLLRSASTCSRILSLTSVVL